MLRSLNKTSWGALGALCTLCSPIIGGAWCHDLAALITLYGMFELWQSHCKDRDGVLAAKSSFGRPWPSSGAERTRYQLIGEIAFNEEEANEVRKSIRERPFGLLLMPHVLVSYYDRYATPRVGLKMLLVLYGWDALKTWLVQNGTPCLFSRYKATCSHCSIALVIG